MGLFAIIPQSHCVIVERMGKFSRIQHSGLRFILPFIERRKVFYGKEWTYNGENCAHKRFGSFSALELSDQQSSSFFGEEEARERLIVYFPCCSP